jgi:hypothetical protein
LTSSHRGAGKMVKKHLLLDINIPPSELGLPNVIQINAQDIELVYHKRWVDEIKYTIQWILSATKKDPETKTRFREDAEFEFGPPPPKRGNPDRLVVKGSGLRIAMPRDSSSKEKVIFEIDKVRLTNASLPEEDRVGMNGVAMERFSIRASGFRMLYEGYPRLVGAGDGGNVLLKSNGTSSSEIFDMYQYDCAKPTDRALLLIRATDARILFDDLASGFDRPLNPVPMRVFLVAREAEAWLPEKTTDALKWLFKANKEEKSQLMAFPASVRGKPTNINIKLNVGPDLELTIFERVDPYPVGYVDGAPRARHLMGDVAGGGGGVGGGEGSAAHHGKQQCGSHVTKTSPKILDKALRPLRKTAKAVAKLAVALSSRSEGSSPPPVGRRTRAQATSDPIAPLLAQASDEVHTLDRANDRIRQLEELTRRLESELDAKDTRHGQRMKEISDILSSLSKRISMACDRVVETAGSRSVSGPKRQEGEEEKEEEQSGGEEDDDDDDDNDDDDDDGNGVNDAEETSNAGRQRHRRRREKRRRRTRRKNNHHNNDGDALRDE